MDIYTFGKLALLVVVAIITLSAVLTAVLGIQALLKARAGAQTLLQKMEPGPQPTVTINIFTVEPFAETPMREQE